MFEVISVVHVQLFYALAAWYVALAENDK